MGLLGNLAAAAAGAAGGARPQDRTPVPFAGPGRLSTSWSVGGSKTTALTVPEWNSTIYGIVDAQATAQAQITWRLYRSASSGRPEDRVEVAKHPALSVWSRPNEFYTQDDLVEVMFNHYELTGEIWLLPAYSKQLPSAGPVELWAVRPDKMRPIAHPEEFISGYVFQSGRDLIELGRRDVIFEKKQHPTDPYRGISPITAAMVNLRADREAAEYNASFFQNDATPGGIVKVPAYLPDDRWRELTTRWNEQHQGRGNAHRIHVMDNVAGAEYVDLKYTRKDMQFTELRSWSVEDFMRGYRISDFVLGMITDVNRATAEAADVWFGKAHVIPRANRTRAMLNYKFLPLFGAMGKGYEFDYDDPIPPDAAQALEEEVARLDMALALIAEGFDEAEVFEHFELPAFKRTRPSPATVPPVAPAPGVPPVEPGDDAVAAARARLNGHRAPATV